MSGTPTNHACGKCGAEVEAITNVRDPYWVCGPCSIAYEPGGQSSDPYCVPHNYKTTPMSATVPVATPVLNLNQVTYRQDGHEFKGLFTDTFLECSGCTARERRSTLEFWHTNNIKGVRPSCAGASHAQHVAMASAMTQGQKPLPPAQFWMPIPTGQDLYDAGFRYMGSDEEPKKVSARPTCSQCSVELSSYLDCYHGKDTSLGGMCSPCRTGVEKKRKSVDWDEAEDV